MTDTALIKPYKFASPIAISGDRGDKEIPVETTTDPTVISQEFGFQAPFSNPRKDQGRSIPRTEFNAILYAISSLRHYFQYMGRNPWSEDLANAGYPLGAIVWHDGAEYENALEGNHTEPGTPDADDKWAPTKIEDRIHEISEYINGLIDRVEALEVLRGLSV